MHSNSVYYIPFVYVFLIIDYWNKTDILFQVQTKLRIWQGLQTQNCNEKEKLRIQ